ncbi:MAG TPA: hypothetical protein VI076_04090 [Actinopolymorphaceae bacterium]
MPSRWWSGFGYVEDFEKDLLTARHVRAGAGGRIRRCPRCSNGPFGDGCFAVSRPAYGDFLDEPSGPQIGLEHQKYDAFTGNRPEVERNTERTLDLVRQAKAVLGTRDPTRWS